MSSAQGSKVWRLRRLARRHRLVVCGRRDLLDMIELRKRWRDRAAVVEHQAEGAAVQRRQRASTFPMAGSQKKITSGSSPHHMRDQAGCKRDLLDDVRPAPTIAPMRARHGAVARQVPQRVLASGRGAAPLNSCTSSRRLRAATPRTRRG